MEISDYFCMAKLGRSITIDKELVEWIKSEIEKKRFKDVSHAIEFAVYRLKVFDEKGAT